MRRVVGLLDGEKAAEYLEERVAEDDERDDERDDGAGAVGAEGDHADDRARIASTISTHSSRMNSRPVSVSPTWKTLIIHGGMARTTTARVGSTTLAKTGVAISA